MSVKGGYADNPNDLMIGRGKMYFNRLVAGVGVGSRYLGNGELFEINVQDDIKEKYSSSESASGLLASINIRRTFELAASLDEFSRENVALALMGTAATDTQTVTDVVDEAHADIAIGSWSDLGNGTVRQVTTVVVKKASTVLTEHVEYEVDYAAGRIFWKGGLLADLDDPTVSYHRPAHTGVAIAAGVSNTVEGELLFIGDPATGPRWRIRVWKVQVTPDGPLGFIADDFGAMKIKCKAIKDSVNHSTEPFFHADLIS